MLPILFQSQDLLAIDKPSGLPSIPADDKYAANILLAQQLKIPFSGPTDPRVRVIHRIDRETSGVLLFALNRNAHQFVSLQFQNHQVEKTYLALVMGSMQDDEGEIDAPIARYPSNKLRRRVHKTGKPALTRWQVVERFRDHTLVRLFPKTGRTHQIRVHLSHLGHPLAIDRLYNPGPTRAGIFLSQFKRNYRQKPEGERPLIARLTLHAESLKFKWMDESMIEIRSELPKDFLAVMKGMRKWS